MSRLSRLVSSAPVIASTTGWGVGLGLLLALGACRGESTQRAADRATRPPPRGNAVAPERSPATRAVGPGFPGVELLASCAGRRATGKRHQSYFYTFRVERVTSGSFPFVEYTSQELFADFGGTQLAVRFDASRTEGSCRHEAVLKLLRVERTPMGMKLLDPEVDGGAGATWSILWAARREEADSFRALEATVHALAEAVDREDIGLVRPFLASDSNLTASDLGRLAEDRHAPGVWSSGEAVGTSLLEEREGVVQIGGGGASYAIDVVRDASGGWRVTKLTWRRP